MEATENLDFRHSSGQTWNLIEKLEPDKAIHTNTIPPVSADELASEIKRISKRLPNYAFERAVKHEAQKYNTPWPETSELSSAIGEHEMRAAIKHIKNGKATRVDGVYPGMMTHLRPAAIRWLASALSNAISKCYIPETRSHAKIIVIFKLGKAAHNPDNYRPIALLCCGFKLLERIILNRILPILDPHIPINQAGFRTQRDTTEQILALTSFIECGFQNKLKTGGPSLWTSLPPTTRCGTRA